MARPIEAHCSVDEHGAMGRNLPVVRQMPTKSFHSLRYGHRHVSVNRMRVDRSTIVAVPRFLVSVRALLVHFTFGNAQPLRGYGEASVFWEVSGLFILRCWRPCRSYQIGHPKLFP